MRANVCSICMCIMLILEKMKRYWSKGLGWREGVWGVEWSFDWRGGVSHRSLTNLESKVKR